MKRFAGFFLTMACLGWVLWGLDFAALGAALASLAPLGIAVAGGLAVAGFLLQGWRLRLASCGVLGLRPCVEAVFLGQGANHLLPAKAGELAKVWFLRRHAGASWGEGLVTVFWERMVDLNVLLALLVLAAFASGAAVLAWPLAVVVVGLWGLVALARLAPSLLGGVIARLPFIALRGVAHDAAVRIHERLTPAYIARLAWITAVLWALSLVQLWAMVSLAGGVELSAMRLLVVSLALAGAWAVPSTPGALGVFEAAMVAALVLYGVPKEQALALSVALHAVLTLVAVSGLCVVLWRHGLRLSDMNAGA